MFLFYVQKHKLLSTFLNKPHFKYLLETWTLVFIQYKEQNWRGSWFHKKCGKPQLLSAHSWINSLAFVCIFIYGRLGRRRKNLPSNPMECVHRNTSICTLECHIENLALMASIPVFPFWNQWRILPFKKKSLRIWAKEYAILRCARMHCREKLQTPKFTAHKKRFLTRLFLPCVTRYMQGNRFGFQVRGWQG